jgi:serine/threonine protein phosphatase PrpC
VDEEYGFSRFVLASDGVWDVIDEELIRKMGLYYKYKDPRDLAIYLAEKAVKRRTKQGLSKDDITGSRSPTY